MMVALEEVSRDFITQESQQQHRDGGGSSHGYSPISSHSVLNAIRIGVLKKVIIVIYSEAYHHKSCVASPSAEEQM